MKNIIKDLKNKKELKGLPDSFFTDLIKKELEQNTKLKLKLKEPFKQAKRSKVYKNFIKNIRKESRRAYGMFIRETEHKRRKLLKLYEDTKNQKFLKKILATHVSSLERLENYTTFYEQIFKKINKVESILDLGCGFNPISYNFMKIKPKYYAIDLSPEDMDFITDYFKIDNIPGNATHLDLIKEYSKLKNIKVDVCFAFKLFDSLEEQKRNITKEILKNINSTWLITTFPTVSLGGNKPIKTKKRVWFEKLFTKIEVLELSNERIYLCLMSDKKA